MILYDCDYVIRDNLSIPRLWRKDGTRTWCEELPNRPYFLVEGDSLPVGLDDPAILGTEVVERIVGAAKKKLVKVTVKSTGDVVRLRDEWPKQGLKLWEYDIRFETRILIDRREKPFEGPETLTVMAVDIEAFRADAFPDPDKTPIAVINLGYRTDGQERIELLKGPGPGQEAEWERTVLQQFVEKVKQVDPDVLATYNGNDFDWPYIVQRAEMLGVKLDMGRDGTDLVMGKYEPQCAGRVMMDMLPIARRDLDTVKVKTLKAVCDSLGLLKETDREMIKGEDLHKEWHANPERVLQYSRDDAKATLLLGENLLAKMVAYAQIAYARISDMAHMRRGPQVEHALMAEAVLEGRVIPPSQKGDDDDDEKFEGAVVLDSPHAAFEDVYLVDFASAYPAVMIKYNISPESFCEDAACTQEHHVSPFIERVTEEKGTKQKKVVWSGSHRFHKEPEGFITRALKKFNAARKPWKKKLGELAENSPAWQEAYNFQDALKKCANSLYGVMGWVNGRWSILPCAESITAWCRDNILRAVQIAKGLGLEALYGDSDSLFLRGNLEVLKTDFLARVRKELGVEMEYKDHFLYWLGIVKKRWAGLKWNNGKLILEVKGLETKRGDWCALAKDTQMAVLDAVLRDRNVDKAVKLVRDAVTRLRSGSVTQKEVTIFKGLYSLSEYKSYPDPRGYPSHVRAFLRELGPEQYRNLVKTKPGYVVTRKKNAVYLHEKIRPLATLSPDDKLDYDYYIIKQVIPAGLRVLECFKWNGRPITEEVLKGERAQAALAEF